MKNKKKIFILIITCISLIGINIYADSNSIDSEINNFINNTISINENDINSVNKNNINEEYNTNNENNTVKIQENQATESTKEVKSINFGSYNTKTNGIYKIAVGVDSSKTIEVAGSSKANNAKMDIWNYGNAEAQKFYFEYKDGYYKILAKHTGKSLTVKNNNIKEGTEIVQADYTGSEGQKWILRDSKKNGWVISLLSNPNLSIYVENNIVNGSKIVLATTQIVDNQLFYLYNINNEERTKSDGIYKCVIGAEPSKSIEVAGSSKANNAKVDIWDYGNAEAQKFYFEYKDGYYKILAKHTGKSLTVKNNNIKEGTEIVQADYTGSEGQKWIIKDSHKNGWVISLLDNPELTISVEGNITNGAKLILSNLEYNNNQMLYLYNINVEERTKNDGMYELLVGANQVKSIEIAGSSKENNAKVDIWDYGNVDAQKFNLEYKDGYYKISAKHTGKSLTVKENNIKEGTEIVQADYIGSEGQKWVIRDSRKNGWIISLQNHPELSLSIEGNIVNGSKIILSNTASSNNQMLYLVETVDSKQIVSNGLYKLNFCSDTNKTIGVAGSSMENNAKVDIWDYGNVDAQKFNLEFTNGSYKIIAEHSKKSLTVKNNDIKNGAEIVQDEFKGELGQMWIISKSNANGYIISSVLRPDLSITVENNNITNGSKLVLSTKKYSNGQQIQINWTSVGVKLDNNKYPGIEYAVNKLINAHPNWEFEFIYTTLDFNTAVKSEYEYKNKQGNLVYTPTYKGDWIAPEPFVSGSWASASYNGIAYFMDVRNFLNDVDVFQFVNLGDYSNSGATLSSIQYQVEGTFLENYAYELKSACENTNINPYYVIARLFQEQSKNGSATINMDGGDGKRYFNPFNIGAKVGNDVATALEKAKKSGWDTMQKGLEGGIAFLKAGYIDRKQHTLYLNKFDVNPASGGGFYSHQYMQNLSAAYSEARTFRGAYEDTGTLNNHIKFVIPLYENMPTKISERPSGKETSEKGPKNVQVINISTTLKVRQSPSSSSAELERLSNGTIMLSVERLQSGWYKVITTSGKVGYCSSQYLKIINDVTNCNDSIEMTTSAYIRIGPGTNFETIKMAKQGERGTRILTNVYYSNNYWWDEVILSDGTKGFIASKYIKKIS